MSARTSLVFYSAWSACVALSVVSLGTVRLLDDVNAPHEWVYFLCVGLFHAIFTIWCAKGRELPTFQHATIVGRLTTAAFAALIIFLSPTLLVVPLLANEVRYYAIAVMVVDIGSAIWTWRVLQRVATASANRISFEGKNRIAFGIYMIVIGSWQLIAPNTLLDVLHMPATAFGGISALSFGPIHILGVQILVLAAYNFVAARHDLKPLIDAGMRGGIMTAIAFLVLVTTGLIHPINLLLPAVDVLSVTATAIHRVRSRA